MDKYIFNKHVPYIVLLGAIMHNISSGLLNSYGNLTLYLTSYLRYKGNNITYREVSLIYDLCVIMVGLSMLAGNYIIFKLGKRTCIILIDTLTAISFYFAYIYAHSFIILCLSLGIMHGISHGIGYIIMMSSIYEHFKKNRGLISGIVISTYSLSPFIYCLIQNYVINKNSISPISEFPENSKEVYYQDENLLNNIPKLLLIQTILYFVFCFISGYLLTFKSTEQEITDQLPNVITKKSLNVNNGNSVLGNKLSSDKGKQSINDVSIEIKNRNKNGSMHMNTTFCNNNTDNDVPVNNDISYLLTKNDIVVNDINDNKSDINVNDQKNNNAINISDNNIIQNDKQLGTNQEGKYYNQICTTDKKYIFIWISFVLFNSFINFIIIYWKIIGVMYTSVEDNILTFYGIFLNSIFNISGRLFVGYVYDVYSIKNVILGLSICVGITCYSIPLFCHIYVLYTFMCAMLYFCIGGGLVSIPIICVKVYGEKHLPLNLSILYSSRIANTLVCNIIIKILYKMLSVRYLSYAFGAINNIAAVCLFMIMN